MVARPPVVQPERTKPGWVLKGLRSSAHIMTVLLLSLVMSILIEWVGMIRWWPHEGPQHSERVLHEELQYLDQDFAESVLGVRSADAAGRAADWIRARAYDVGLDRFSSGIGRGIATLGGRWPAETAAAVRSLDPYLTAMLNVMQVFTVRVFVLLFALPAFGLFGLVGLVEGLMRRDLRRWGGGRESSFVYHHSKQLIGPSVLSAWMLYLAAPFSVHPTVVLIPFAVLFGMGVGVTAATFKKYL